MSDIKADTPAQETVAAPVEAPKTDAPVDAPMADASVTAPVEAPTAPAVAEQKKDEAETKPEEKKAESPKQQRDNGAKREYKKFVNKSKFDAASLPVTDNADEIRAQVCFFPSSSRVYSI